MIERYIQLSKEKIKLEKLYKKQETLKVNKFFFFSTLFLLFGMISAFLFNLNFAFNIYDYNTFLESNGIENILVHLRTPSLFNGDFSVLHDERTSFIVQEELFVSNVNSFFMSFLVFFHVFMYVQSLKLNEEKKYKLYNSSCWIFQSVYSMGSFVFLALFIFIPYDFVKDVIPAIQIDHLPVIEYVTFNNVQAAARAFEGVYAFAYLLGPVIILLYALSIYKDIKNMKKYKSLNKEIQNEHLKEELKKYNEKINDIQTKIVKSNLLKKEILIKIEKTKDKDEYSILMDIIEFDIKYISKDEQKIKLFTKNNHETNNIENI